MGIPDTEARDVQPHVDLAELCSGLLGSIDHDATTVTTDQSAHLPPPPRKASTTTAEGISQAVGDNQDEIYDQPDVIEHLYHKSPHSIASAPLAQPAAALLPPNDSQLMCQTASPPTDESDDGSGQSPCWGGMLKGDAGAGCDPSFTSGKAHFKNKFCMNCRRGIEVPVARVRAVHPEGHQALYANSLRPGFWKYSSQALGGGEVRIANNTITCDGPWLVVYRKEAPSGFLPWATDLPEGWADASGSVRFAIAKGTLVPTAEMLKKPGQSKASGLVSAGAPAYQSGPKRQRRAPQPDVSPSDVPPGGLPPSVRRGFSASSSDSLVTANARLAASHHDSPVLSTQPLVQAPPPLTVPPACEPLAQQITVVGASLFKEGDVASPATLLVNPTPPASPEQLACRLASTYQQAANMIENALQPLSPVRSQLPADRVNELLMQLNATRAAIAACQRMAGN